MWGQGPKPIGNAGRTVPFGESAPIRMAMEACKLLLIASYVLVSGRSDKDAPIPTCHHSESGIRCFCTRSDGPRM